jgi:hypothetical protein
MLPRQFRDAVTAELQECANQGIKNVAEAALMLRQTTDMELANMFLNPEDVAIKLVEIAQENAAITGK